MRDVVALVIQVAFVIFVFITGARVLDIIGTPGETVSRRFDMSAGTIWTAEPVRVDPRRQTYERIPLPPDPFPLKLRANAAFRVLTNNSFSVNGRNFHLAGIERMERNKICTRADGRRFACGLNAFKALERAVRGRLLECRVVGEDDAGQAVECRIGGRDLHLLL